MIIPIELSFKADKDTRLAFSTNKTIKSHDVHSVEFHIAIEGLELTNNHTAKILSIFHSSKSQVNTDCEIVDGKIIYKPDTKLISMYETVTNYVYVYYNDQSLDVCEFKYTVKLSKIDETVLEVKEVYDQSYADLLANFEKALSDYKDSLPQADSVRADIDVILNQFGVDSQAKLSQFDTDAQQVIADNQTAFDLAESKRQNTYEQAEDIRNQTTNQAVVDWKQGTDGLVDSKLSEIQTDASTLINGAIDDFNQRGDAEIAEWRGNADSELEEYLADRVVLENLIANGDFSQGKNHWKSINSYISSQIEDGTLTVTTTSTTARILTPATTIMGHKYYLSVQRTWSETVKPTAEHFFIDNILGVLNLGTSSSEETLSTVFTSTISGSQLSVYQRNTTALLTLDNIVFLDLTTTFGAGNEPTKAEMDELIKITGYFDEITLTQKQMLTWQLKLMRQNRNALIALGGTII